MRGSGYMPLDWTPEDHHDDEDHHEHQETPANEESTLTVVYADRMGRHHQAITRTSESGPALLARRRLMVEGITDYYASVGSQVLSIQLTVERSSVILRPAAPPRPALSLVQRVLGTNH